MTREEFEVFLRKDKNYSKNNKTKSFDEEVLNIYSYILQYEKIDSDWWNGNFGTTDVMYMIKNSDENIFEKIKQDIINWSNNQIELFAQSLISNHLKDFKVNERIKLYIELFEMQIEGCDISDSFYGDANINLEIANSELLLKLAEKLNYVSVEDLMNSVSQWQQ